MTTRRAKALCKPRHIGKGPKSRAGTNLDVLVHELGLKATP